MVEGDDEVKTYYKLARPDGFDFYTGKTINYRDNIGKTVVCPDGDKKLGVCSRGVIHASVKPKDCFVGARIPCSAYIVSGKPVCGDEQKYGFLELTVLEEVTDLDTLFGWNYTEICNPFNPLTGKPKEVKQEHIENLHKWDSVRDSVGDSVRASVRDSVGDSVRASVWDSVRASVWDSVRASVRDSVGDSVWDSAWDSVGDSVGDSVRASVWDSVRAYIGSLFPNVTDWKYVEHKPGEYPFQPAIDLWKAGFVPSFDGSTWRLHSGKSAKVVYEEMMGC